MTISAFKKFKIFFILSSFIAFFMPALSWAQVDVETQTREVNRPILQEIEQTLSPAKDSEPEIEKEEMPAVEEGPKFLVKEILLEGVTTFDPKEFAPLLEQYTNREISLAQLKQLTKSIEKEYLKKGVIAACIIPPQKSSDGIITLRIIEAKMGQLNVKPHKYFNNKRINYYWLPESGKILKYGEMNKSLHMINKNPDRKAKATLHPGEVPETTDVTIETATEFPYHLTGSFDKEGVASTGEERKGLGFKHNNFLNLDDTVVFGENFGDDFNSIYAFHSIPLNKHGTSVVYGYSYSKSFPKKEFEVFGIASRSRNSSISIKQDFFVDNQYAGEVSIGLDANDKWTQQNAITTTKDRLRILRYAGQYLLKGNGQLAVFDAKASQGINGFGARRQNILSSRGSKNTFTKFNFNTEYRKALPKRTQLDLKVKSQIASNKLPSQEQFYLGGINSVRGYPSGDFLGDDGVVMNVEFIIPAFFIPNTWKLPYMTNPLQDYFTLVTFYDYGWANKRHPSSSELDTANFMSIGGGIRINLFNRATIRLESGTPIADETITESGKTRFHFSINFES